MQPDLDRLYLRGKISEDEYFALAMEDGQVVAIGIDEVDRITTVSLSTSPKGFNLEIFSSPEESSQYDNLVLGNITLKEAKIAFKNTIKKMEYNNRHKFEIDWFCK